MANALAPITFPTILCFRCKKPVERIATDVCDYRMVIKIRVYCHGETDEMELTRQFQAELDGDITRETGIAFAPKADNLLPAPAQEAAHG